MVLAYAEPGEENWARSNSMMNMKISMLIEKGDKDEDINDYRKR